LLSRWYAYKTFWISWARGLERVCWFLGLYPFKNQHLNTTVNKFTRVASLSGLKPPGFPHTARFYEAGS
ncbi:hypothetical protein MEO41_26740, partial [Dolichospermum sp. ST_sed4]|nr:hypothetical protein [Dolichospermum sp. ST_sed4]